MKMKKVVVIGAGWVASPLVRYLLNIPYVKMMIVDRVVSRAEKMIDGHPRGEFMQLDLSKENSLEDLIKEADIAISLVPYAYHVKVAKLCIRHKIPMVTTSYVSDAMKELDAKAKKAGVLLLNEIGVDPGIDHMSAMIIVNQVKDNGGDIVSFRSFCGGLPAPEANTNPFGYKFSWSPRGVLMAATNDAKYLKDGKVIFVPAKDLFTDSQILTFDEIGALEAYPNRNALPYIELYNLDKTQTMFRGTLRNVGWCEVLKNMVDIGFPDDSKSLETKSMTYREFVKQVLGSEKDPKEAISDKLGIKPDSRTIEWLDWLGYFGEDKIGVAKGTALDVLCERMQVLMKYEPGERDMIVLHHEFIAQYSGKKEMITSTLIDYGIPNGNSSMSRTVSLPAAIATGLILEGKIDMTGVHIPVAPEIYNPVMAELENMGIQFVENSKVL